MEIIKKNMISVICGVIALAAIIALLWPVSGMYADTQKELNARAKQSTDIGSLQKLKRQKPVLSENATPEPLTDFPTKPIIDKAKIATDEIHRQATRILATAVEVNHAGHNLLVAGVLPRPDLPGVQRFRDAYMLAMKPVKAGQKPTEDNIPDGILNAAPPPTNDEMQTAKDKLFKEKYEQRIVTDQLGRERNRPEVQAQFDREHEHFAEEFRRERSMNHKLYMDDESLTLVSSMDPAQSTAPTTEDIWYAQMGVWVQQDVARGIALINKDSISVQQSPVKNLFSIEVAKDDTMYILKDEQQADAAAADGSTPAAGSSSGGVPKVFTKTPTGRICNSLFDVVHFRVMVICEEARVKEFIQALEQGRFISVLDLQVQKVDSKAVAEEGFDYGDKPVVKLTIKCEELFMRDWTARGKDAPMPATIQKKLGIQAPSSDSTPKGPVASSGQ